MLYMTGAAGLTRRFMKGILGRWSNLTLTASTTSTFRLSGREKGSSIGSDTSTSNYYIDPYMQWAPEDTPTQVVQATRLLAMRRGKGLVSGYEFA